MALRRAALTGRSFFAWSASAPVLGELPVLTFAGWHASRTDARRLVGLRQIHSHQARPIHGRPGRPEQPCDLVQNCAEPASHKRRIKAGLARQRNVLRMF